jgi:glycosyltransferase involved in cell wall biosynthesis
MLDLSVIILTYNEEIHIQRCIENVKSFAREIYLVDSFSTDRTAEIAKSLGAQVFQNKWENNYARQFNWGLENLPITTKWVLRLDADEYLLPELVEELQQKISDLPNEVTGIVFKRRHIFLGKWMKRGIYPVKLLRMFQYKKAICEQRWMDEHMQLLEGTSIEFEHDFVDHNLNNLSWFLSKHIGYSIREAIDLLDVELGLIEEKSEVRSPKSEVNNQNTESRYQTYISPTSTLSRQAAEKRQKKLRYAKQPLFWRSFAYFVYRYFFKLGFLEGKEGFQWHFFQGWWYRTLVDAKVFEIKKACGKDKEKIKEYIRREYGLEV